MAINILGCLVDSAEVETTKSPEIANAITRGIIERSFADENTPIDSDLNFIDHDRFVVHALASIADMKKNAVRNENYPLAKSLKKLQEEFNATSAEISVLLAEKRSCLLVEDYDKAQTLQASVQNKKDGLVQQLNESGYELREEGLVQKRKSLTTSNNSLAASSNQYLQTSGAIKSNGSFKKSVNNPAEGTSALADSPIKSKYAEQMQAEVQQQSESRPSSARDSEAAKPLTREEEIEFASCIAVFGRHCMACVLSPIFSHREEGMKIADTILKDTEKERDLDEVVKATFQILALVGSDARERSHALMINLFYSLIGIYSLSISMCRYIYANSWSFFSLNYT